jgi:cell division protein FtsW
MVRKRKSNTKTLFDKRLFYIAIILTVIGVIAVTDASFYSALSNYSDKFYFAKQQLIWGLTGIVVMIGLSFVNFKIYEKFALPLFIVSLIFLILVLIPGFSTRIYGARRWLSLGFVGFQPSEIVKLSLVIYFSKLASNNKRPLSFFLVLGIVCGLIMLQPDLGTTIVIACIGLAQIFVSGVNIFQIIGAVFLGGVSSIVLILTSSYRKARLMTFFQSSDDPLGKSYHIRQILIGLGSGGLFGIGLGESKQKFLFLPEAATDSIFAVIAEEIGFLGAGFLIILLASYVYLGILIAKNAPDTFSKMLAIGIIAWIGGQTFVNIASMTALVPLTGIPLPFISYGGSSLLSVLAASGILLNISRYKVYETKKRH